MPEFYCKLASGERACKYHGIWQKPDKVSIRVGETYTLPDDVIIETLGDVRYSNPSKIVVSDDGKITAMQKGIVKVKYTQSGKTRIIMKIKISN